MAKFIAKVVPEPIWEKGDPATRFQLVEALRWYTDNKSDKDARTYLMSYVNSRLTNTQKQAATFVNLSWNMTDGWAARCLSRGALLPKNSMSTFNDNLNRFIDRLDSIIVERGLGVVTTTNTNNIISIQERVQNKVDYFIMELEAKFDNLWHRNSKEEFVAYAWMIENEVKPMHAAKISEYFRKRATEFVQIIEYRKTDEYIKESYPRTQKEMVLGATILLTISTDADKLASNKNAAKKPRKSKPISVEKKVAKLNYKKDDVENKLVSINPVKILGAEKLWIYNIKTRKLGVYVTVDAAGLSVKGSTIENYKYSESITKTLRKPKDILSRVLDGGKIVLRKVMSEINSKPQELNGRINKDIILLRVE